MTQRPHSRQRAWAALAAVAAAALAVGCTSPAASPTPSPFPAFSGPTSPRSTNGTPPPVATTPPAVAAPPSGAAAPRVSATRSPALAAATTPPPPTPLPPAAGSASPPGCPSSGLSVSLGPPNGALGSTYYPLLFSNSSGRPCTLYGYPGVSFVTAIGGSQVGGTAARDRTFAPHLISLAPGQSAHASLRVVVAPDYPALTCKPVTAHWLRVYPPNQTAPLYVRFTSVTCTGKTPDSTLGIYVVRPGTSGP